MPELTPPADRMDIDKMAAEWEASLPNIGIISKARDFAYQFHGAIGHRRKYTSEPYTTHLRNVAFLTEQALGIGRSPDMVAAAWLHDAVEDTPATHEDIMQQFGSIISRAVYFLTDTPPAEGLNRAKRKELDRNRLLAANSLVKTIKLADLIDNTRSIVKHDPAFAKVYLKEKQKLLPCLADGLPSLLAPAKRILCKGLEEISTQAGPKP